ncbi:MAG: protein kinase [Candidatus Acidiferrales bacterium]
MTPERWAQIEELFHRAAERAPEQRNALLNEACGNDPELRREVEALLSVDAGAGESVQDAVRGGLEDAGFPLSGETISHYHILEGLGGGGMGLVYRAEDIKLGRQVALKFLPEESVKDPAALGRFEREARSASALEHPSICPIYEFGEHEGQPFLVMQLLEGQTLRELLTAAGPGKPPLEIGKLLELAIQILDGLDAAHQNGIVHRDIKPANIFITRESEAKILDFGLAKLGGAHSAEKDDLERSPRGRSEAERISSGGVPRSTPDQFLSLTGVAMGTAGYMSPEQVRGEKLDARTDLFSFGLVLYEMATGKRAFAGDTGPELQEAILSQMPSPAREVNPKLPGKLETIIGRALEKDREARYQSASEMRTDLENLKREIEPKTRARWREIAAAIVVLTFATGAFWFARRQPRSAGALPEIKWRQLTSNSSESVVSTGSISRDGKYLMYPDALGINVKQIATGEVQNIPLPKEIKSNTLDWAAGPWFPDGKTFLANAFPLGVDFGDRSSLGSSIWVFSLSGKAPRKLRDEAYLDSISPDGSLIAFETHHGKIIDCELWVMQSNGEQARRVFGVDEESTIEGLHWSQDGERVIFLRQDGPDKANTYVVSGDLRGGPLTKIPLPYDNSKSDAWLWLPDGRFIFRLDEPGTRTLTCNLWLVSMDQRLTKFIGKPRRLTNLSEQCIVPWDSTWDSKQVLTQQWREHSNVYLADLQAGGTRVSAATRLTLDESWNDPLGWTADSKAVIFSSTRSGTGGFFKQALGQDVAVPLLTVKAGENIGSHACLSPDGSWVLYEMSVEAEGPSAANQIMRVPTAGGTPEFVMRANLEERPRCARSPATLCAIAERSADRKQLVFTAFDPLKGRGRELAKFQADPTADYHWDVSPDGTRIALLKDRDGRVEILSLNGRAPQEITARGWDNLFSVNWAADGKALFVSGLQQRGSVLLHLDLQSNAHFLWEHRGGEQTYGVASPDGRHLAMRGWNNETNLWMMENF